jgi:hypothetical protein
MDATTLQVFLHLSRMLDRKDRRRKRRLNSAVLWNVTPRGTCRIRRFGGTSHHHQGGRISWLETALEVTSNWSTLIIEPIRSSETSFLQDPQGDIYKHMTFFIFIAVKTSNLTNAVCSRYVIHLNLVSILDVIISFVIEFSFYSEFFCDKILSNIIWFKSSLKFWSTSDSTI